MSDYFYSLDMMLQIHGHYVALLYTGLFERLAEENNQ